ncbi:ABC transporter substrate-binding protein [Glycomyces mayteni]|uniref:ABC transporter substrate-binding protein n=1 Tax=Glycomyces mayteni TaxID=543887 RepID=A0ABW2D8A7_9ACTN|nr:ABC transporter substrate-binding protein [Glycomyces mayteni]
MARTPRRRWTLVAAAAAALAALAVLAVVLVARASAPEPVYVAVAGDLGGADVAEIETDLLPGVQLAADRLNAAGGIGGRTVEILAYDDGGDPLKAKDNAEAIVADGRAVAVIGHTTTDPSIAASPVYAAAGLPAISPSATGDDLTANRPWYFQGIFDNTQQGAFLAAYVDAVLGLDRATVVHGDDRYGTDIHEGFTSAFGGTEQEFAIDLAGDAAAAVDDAAAAAIAADPDRGAIVLGLRSDLAGRLIPALRAAGVTEPVIGGDKLSSEVFTAEIHEALVADGVGEAALAAPIYATAPVLTDSLTGESLRFLLAFVREHGYVPDWPALTGGDALALIADGLEGASLDPADRAADRELLRDAWAATDSPETAAEGLTGPLYFDDRTLVRPVRMGMFSGTRPVSAPVQLVPYTPASGQDAGAELADGTAVEFEQEVLVPSQIVSTGVNINEIRDLDTQAGTFSADMFIWFNYTGGDDVLDVWFPNSADKSLSLGDPLEAKQVGDTKYRLFHVEGTFKADLEFRRFPFDVQHLPIVLQNRTLPDCSVVYALDAAVRAQTQAERLASAGDATSTIDSIPNWRVDQALFTAETVGTTANMGDPSADAAGGLYYSQFVTDLQVRRDVGGFLVKNLLPLGLLVMATYVSLFLGYDAVTSRVSMAITGILSSAVMLNSVTGVLPAISYTVAIEWLYYLFILICVGLLVIDLVGSSWAAHGRKRRLKWLTVGSRIAYPAVVLGAALTYWLVFA